MPRTLKPEILDSLAPDDPAALHNRRDLRIINRIMGNPSWFARALAARLRPGDRVLEIGAGTGELGRALAAKGIPIDGLDLWPRPADWPAGRTWHRKDLRAFDGYGAYDVIIANLVLHQFNESELAGLGHSLRGRVRMILACEPARRQLSRVLCAVAGRLFGANFVTRHDSRVSIDAGFLDAELPLALDLPKSDWRVARRQTILGAYRMVAVKIR
jgi:2-polyprenyl-3-methyl-5-hydroxy-6-metoxy-1,4-benzoquinol methylase